MSARGKRNEAVPMIGLVFGSLTVIGKAPPGKSGCYWHCRCRCGGEKVVYGGHLRAGSIVSCGCVQERHGMALTPEYKAWDNARHRCRNPKDRKYPLYGGRGIKVCERWLNSFSAFFADMGLRPSRGHSLERKNSNGDYEPNNCIWATIGEQNNNRPGYNRLLTVDGERLTVAQASKLTGIPHATILSRLDSGKSDAEAVRK